MSSFSSLTDRTAVANQGGAMEADTISKNGRSSNSHTSRGNFLRKAFFSLLALSVIFSGCNDEDDNGLVSGGFDGRITVTKIENASEYSAALSQVTQVRAVDLYFSDRTIATGSFANGGFTLNLLQTLSNANLYSITHEEVHLFPDDLISISDRNARIAVIHFLAFDGNNEQIGDFIEHNNDGTIEVFHIYADRDVTIDETYFDAKYSVSLKRGWNRLYYVEMSDRAELTTKPVSGMNWYFYGDGSNGNGDNGGNESIANHFNFNDRNYSLDKGFITYFGSLGGNHNFAIYLVSSNVQFSSSLGEFTGAGDVLGFSMWSSSQSSLVNGRYTFSENGNARTFDFAEAGINVNFATEYSMIEIISGSIDVSIIGNETAFTFDLTAAGNAKLTGNFKGILQEISF